MKLICSHSPYRILIGFTLFLLLNISASAMRMSDSVETLAGSNISTGGFGAPVLKVSTIDEWTSWILGVRGGLVIDKIFVVGGGVYGFSHMWMFSTSQSSSDTSSSLFYGGLELEYLLNSNELIHATLLVLIGGGNFRVSDGNYSGGHGWNGNTLFAAGFFVCEPVLNAEVNIQKWLRFSLGLGYRFVSGIDGQIGSKYYTNSTLSGLLGVATLKFGSY